MFSTGFGGTDADLRGNERGARLLRAQADLLATELEAYTALVLRDQAPSDELAAAGERLTDAAIAYETVHVGFTGEPLRRAPQWSDEELEELEEFDGGAIPPLDEIPVVRPWAHHLGASTEETLATTHVEWFAAGCALHVRQLLARGERTREEWSDVPFPTTDDLRLLSAGDDLLRVGGNGAGDSRNFSLEHVFWAPEGTDLSALTFLPPGGGDALPLPPAPAR